MLVENLNDRLQFQTSLSAVSGFLLYRIRNALGLNQRQIAKMFDMSHVTYASMEKGETAINADFIYMLCSFIGYKYSDYFELIDDYILELKTINSCALGGNISVSIIPSTDILKILKSGYKVETIGIKGEYNLIILKDFEFFISKDLNHRSTFENRLKLTPDQIKYIENLDVEELEKNEIIFTSNGALAASGLGMASGTATLGAVLGLNVVSAAVGLVGLGGYELFKAYKKNKEDKKK